MPHLVRQPVWIWTVAVTVHFVFVKLSRLSPDQHDFSCRLAAANRLPDSPPWERNGAASLSCNDVANYLRKSIEQIVRCICVNHPNIVYVWGQILSKMKLHIYQVFDVRTQLSFRVSLHPEAIWTSITDDDYLTVLCDKKALPWVSYTRPQAISTAVSYSQDQAWATHRAGDV